MARLNGKCDRFELQIALVQYGLDGRGDNRKRKACAGSLFGAWKRNAIRRKVHDATREIY